MGPSDDLTQDYAQMLAAFGVLSVTTVAFVGCTAKALHYCWPGRERTSHQSETFNPIQETQVETTSIELVNHAFDLFIKVLGTNSYLLFSNDLLEDVNKEICIDILASLNNKNTESMSEEQSKVSSKLYLTALKELWEKNLKHLYLDWQDYSNLFDQADDDFTEKVQAWGRNQLEILKAKEPEAAKLFHNWLHVCSQILSKQSINRLGSKGIAQYYASQFLSMFENIPESGNFGKPIDVLSALMQDATYKKVYKVDAPEVKKKQTL